MITKVRFFTKKQLIKANTIAIKRGYNKAMDEDCVARLPDQIKYPVTHHVINWDKDGRSCEPHVRVEIVLGVDNNKAVFGILDCEWNLFHKLNEENANGGSS